MNRTIVFVFFSLLVLLNSSCTFLQTSTSNFVASATPIEFSIDDINAVGQAKSVNVGGQASLPNGSQLAISAIRVLEESVADDSIDNEPIYTILDRQFVTVENERWQANLDLQRPDINGNSFENWQFDPTLLKGKLSPDPKVIFLLTLEPTNLSDNEQQALSESEINDGNTQLAYTSSGEPYLQVERTVAIEVPSGNPAKEKDESTLASYSQAWQSRSVYKPEVDSLNEAAQIPFSENDNFSLPDSNMLQ